VFGGFPPSAASSGAPSRWLGERGLHLRVSRITAAGKA